MKLLVESYPFTPELLEEREVTTVLGTEKRLRAGGPFQKADVPNDNSRVYPGPVFEDVLAETSPFKQRLKNRQVFGEMEHPKDGVSNLNRLSHIVDSVYMKKDGLVYGESTIFNIPRTLVLKEVFAVGGQIPVSSRGRGETMTRSDGLEEVQKGYELDTFDFVCTPSVGIARTDKLREAAEQQKGTGVVGTSIRDTLDRVRAVYLDDRSDIVSLAEALIVLRPITYMKDHRKVAREASLLEKRIEVRVREEYGAHSFSRPTTPKKAIIIPGKATLEESRRMSQVKKQALVDSLLPRYLKLKESLQSKTQRYDALAQICEALVRRCRAAEALAEGLLAEARKSRKESQKEKKKGKACESISAELLSRYHKDGAAMFAEGFALGHPNASAIKDALKESRNAHQAAKIASKLVNTTTSTPTERIEEDASSIRELRESHPSRLPVPRDNEALSRLEEAAKRSKVSSGEQDLISAYVEWEGGGN